MHKSKEKGITLISLIITIILLTILVAVSVDLIVDKKVFNSAQDVVNRSEEQMDTHQVMVNEVRDLYK